MLSREPTLEEAPQVSEDFESYVLAQGPALVRRMVLTAHVSRWRRLGRRESPVAEPRMPGTVPGAADTAVAREADGELWAACLRLPWDQRVAVVLRSDEQLAYREIAALTGVAEVTARSRVHRGLTALRKGWADE